MHGLLNNIFKYALSLDMVEKNPCVNIVKTKHETNVGTAFSFAEQKEFFKNLFADETISYQKKCYLIYVYLTGTRRNEALSVCVDDQRFYTYTARKRNRLTDICLYSLWLGNRSIRYRQATESIFLFHNM